MMTDLFSALRPDREVIRDGVVLLPKFCDSRAVLQTIKDIIAVAPFRQMLTPGGKLMSIEISNCGALGWISDRKGYRYSTTNPMNDSPWPAMPKFLFNIGQKAAEKSGFPGFEPDSCLINRYDLRAKLSPHQDKDEMNFSWPIVSLSLGLSAIFRLYGTRRGGRPLNLRLYDGDILVFGGPSRLAYHGVQKILHDGPPHMNEYRINLTFRHAGP